ncbi:MAG: hypothetical protein PUE46_05025 [Eubacteriales bacterium]|nr:hypothetical protein [Eubacteriales bacterium]
MEQNNQQFDNQYYQPNQPQQPQPQYQPPQPQYQPPVYQQPVYDPTREVMSVGSYVLMFILLSIPVVNVICWIVWLVSPDTNKNKKNYVIANIIIYAISVGVLILAGIVMAALGISLAEIGGAALY